LGDGPAAADNPSPVRMHSGWMPMTVTCGGRSPVSSAAVEAALPEALEKARAAVASAERQAAGTI
jgi:hypothetical protein